MKRESIIQRFSICAAIIFIVLISGCVAIGPTVKTYGGDKLQKSKVAVIKGWWLISPFGYGGIDICSIDGSYLGATKVEVLPGWHELEIRSYTFSFFAPVGASPEFAQVAFNFEAGHEYKIRERLMKVDVVDIMDVTTGAIILTEHFSRLTSYPSIGFEAGIQPLPGNHGRWNKEEIDIVKNIITAVANKYGLKMQKVPNGQYSLSGKYYVLNLDSNFLYDNGGRNIFPFIKNPKVIELDLGRKLQKLISGIEPPEKEKGTIHISIYLISFGPSIIDSDRLLIENIWREMLHPIRNEFGERVEEGRNIKIY